MSFSLPEADEEEIKMRDIRSKKMKGSTRGRLMLLRCGNKRKLGDSFIVNVGEEKDS